MKGDPLYQALPDSFEQRGPAPPVPEREPRTWGLSLGGALYLAIATFILMKIVPRFGEVYRQVKIPLPAWTEALLALSRAACAWPGAVYAAILLLPLCLCRLKPRSASIAQVLLPVLLVFLLGWMVVALFMPLMGGLEGIGARRR